MTRQDAHALLNAARAGANVSEQLIVQALKVTGDLGAARLFMDGAADEAPVLPVIRRHLPAGSWERPDGASLLARATPFDGLTA